MQEGCSDMFAIVGYRAGAITFDGDPTFLVCLDGDAQTIRFALGSLHMPGDAAIPVPLKCNDAPLALIGFACCKCVVADSLQNIVLGISHVAIRYSMKGAGL